MITVLVKFKISNELNLKTLKEKFNKEEQKRKK